ncbi:MAG: zf-HC2 domain-containing protein [Lachnospiraceae bacterium]|nr:zf-HC2 domain-containing protein [Lachnospiraceae bacterium]
MENSCGMVSDLLPLYVDGVCSKESRAVVEEHIKECDECKREYEILKEETTIPAELDDTLLHQVKRKIRLEKIVIGIIVALVLLVHLGTAGVVGVIKLFNEWSDMNPVVDADMIEIREDESGDVWLIRRGMAVDAASIVINQYTPEGEVITDFKKQTINSDVDKSHVVVHLELYTSPAIMLKEKVFGEGGNIEEEQSILFNKKERENFEKVVWIEEETGEESVLWER